MGLILAGGRSRRFGSAKAEAGLCGAPLSEWVRSRLAPQVDGVVVSANGPPPTACADLPAVRDTIAGFRGPLAGLLAGLEWMAGQRPEVRWCASASVDVPFLPTDLVARLREAASEEVPAIAASGGRSHPVVGLWPLAVAPALRHYLTAGERSDVTGFAREARARTVDFPDTPFDPFFNINTKDDLEEAERLCGRFRLQPDGQGP